MRRIGAGFLVGGLLCLLTAASARAEGFDYAGWGRLLGRFRTEEGLVRYAALKAERSLYLDPVAQHFAEASPQSNPERFPTRADQLAYWLNAYNFFSLKGAVDGYPTKSVLDLGVFHGFFRRTQHTLGGRELTLWEIEHEIVRGKFMDPRVHFAFNCACRGSQPLWPEPFTGARLEEQLTRAARRYVADERFVAFEHEGQGLALSKIFDWYAKDFERWMAAHGRQEEGLAGFLTDYAPEALAQHLRSLRGQDSAIEYRDYDWSLNDAGGGAEQAKR